MHFVIGIDPRQGMGPYTSLLLISFILSGAWADVGVQVRHLSGRGGAYVHTFPAAFLVKPC